MEQTTDRAVATRGESVGRASAARWKLLALLVVPVALVVDWVGVQLYLDGLRQQAYPSPRAPQLGNVQLAWSGLAIYLAMALFALALASLLPRTPRRAVQTLRWLLGVGVVGLVLMVPATFVWLSRTTPEEGSIVEPGGDVWEVPEEFPGDDRSPMELDQQP